MTTSPLSTTAGQTHSKMMRSMRTMVWTCGRLRQLVPSCFQMYGTASMRNTSTPRLARRITLPIMATSTFGLR